MQFAQPEWLGLLVLAPLLLLWQWYGASRKMAGLPYSTTRTARETPASFWVHLSGLPAILRMVVLILGILALARPQERHVSRRQFAEGVDIMLVLDASTSMRAQDFSPNRFEAARAVASEFISSRISDRVGLVLFAARAFTQTPLTLDYHFIQEMLAGTEMGLIEDGTAIGTALALGVSRLKESEAESKVIILLTDGQNNRGEIDPVTAAGIARTWGVRVYAIGVGAQGKAPMVVDHPFGGRSVQMVPVEIDEEMLQKVARTTGGKYYRATHEQALRRIYEEIGELEKTRIESFTFTDVAERFHLFLWPALILLMGEVWLSNTRLRRFP